MSEPSAIKSYDELRAELTACQGQLKAAQEQNVLMPRNGYSYERIWCRSCLKATKYVRVGNDLLCGDCATIHCSFHAPEATADDVKNFLARKQK